MEYFSPAPRIPLHQSSAFNFMDRQETAVSELFSPLGNVFTHAHHVLQNKLITSYQRPTLEPPKSIFEASAENGLNKQPNVQRQKEHEKNTM